MVESMVGKVLWLEKNASRSLEPVLNFTRVPRSKSSMKSRTQAKFCVGSMTEISTKWGFHMAKLKGFTLIFRTHKCISWLRLDESSHVKPTDPQS